MEILIRNGQRKIPLDKAHLKKKTAAVLEALGQGHTELSVLFTNDAKIRELNYNYRDKDRPTDVLSFPQDEDAVDEDGRRILGDVAISVETAVQQAQDHELTLEQELMLLTIHGVLHLLGHDHERSAKEASFMKRTTKKIFQELYPGVLPSGTSNF